MHSRFYVEPSGQISVDGEEMLNVFFDGECIAVNILAEEIEPVYYQYIMEQMNDDVPAEEC